MEDLVDCQAKDIPVNRRQSIQGVILAGRVNGQVEFPTVFEDSIEQLLGEIADFFPGGTKLPEIGALIRQRIIVQVVTEQKLQYRFPGFSPGAWLFWFIVQVVYIFQRPGQLAAASPSDPSIQACLRKNK
jgi:hypothetical protein